MITKLICESSATEPGFAMVISVCESLPSAGHGRPWQRARAPSLGLGASCRWPRHGVAQDPACAQNGPTPPHRRPSFGDTEGPASNQKS